MSGHLIYNELRSSLGSIALREVIVAHGRKTCTRQSLREWSSVAGSHGGINALATEITDWLTSEGWRLLESTIRKNGFGFALGTQRIGNNIDKGKGGWSNLIELSDAASSSDDAYIYFAPDDRIADAFRIADEIGDNIRVASYLGIPSCCANFFSMVWPSASRHQGDLCPYSCAMSEHHAYPWDWHTNIISQYFGVALISFFPCSFQCLHAKKVGEQAFKILSGIDKEWAQSVQALSKGVFLYTEYQGVYRWNRYTIEGKRIVLSGHAQSTLSKNLICNTKIIEYSTPHDMLLYVEDQVLHLSGADVALCVF
jgi:hypothetical protein